MPFDPTEALVRAARHGLETSHPPPWESPILLAVSGGADSMALLHLLHRAEVPLMAAHFDHQTRDGASAREGELVAARAELLGVPLFRGTGDVAALARISTDSFEMAARKARYAFLLDTARAQGCGAIATGHHADDQAETLLLRLLRGTSPTGMAGIAPVGELDGVLLIRPLLAFRRAALEAWLEAAGIPWMEDESNLDTDVPRNRVRHDLLPDLCRDFNPKTVEALNRLARLQRVDETYMVERTAEARAQCIGGGGRLDRHAFRKLDEALQHRLATALILDAGGDGDYETVCRAVAFLLVGQPGKQIDVGRHMALFCGDGHAILGPLAPVGDVEVILPIPGSVAVAGFEISTSRLESAPVEALADYCTSGRQLFDDNALRPPLTVRTRRPGDRFQPMGMSGTRKLKDYFNSLGLTRTERDRQLLVLSGGEIIWVVGHNIGGQAAVTQDTQGLVEIAVRPLGKNS